MESISEGLRERIKRVRLLVLDVDGVLTDGGIIYDDSGRELKIFDVRDGHGIKMLKRGGVDVALVTARSSKVVLHRASDLGIDLLYQGMVNKLEAISVIMERTGLGIDELAYVGDDVIDIPVLKRVGFSVAVSDAVEEVRALSHYVTTKPGGRGAVREICELILRVQGRWEEVLSRYRT